MGVDTKLYISSDIQPEDVVLALKALGKTNVEWKPTSVAPGYLNIFFDSKDEGRRRMIHFHYHTNEFGMSNNQISLRNDEESVEVFTCLAKMFGGVFQESDYTDDCVMFSKPGSGNIRWLLNRFFATNPEISEDSDLQVKAFFDWANSREWMK